VKLKIFYLKRKILLLYRPIQYIYKTTSVAPHLLGLIRPTVI